MSLRDSKSGFVKVPVEFGVFAASEQGLQIGVITASLDVASVGADAIAYQTFAVAGLDTGDFVAVNRVADTAGLGIIHARVSAADTLTLGFKNDTASPIDPGAGDYKILVVRFNQK